MDSNFFRLFGLVAAFIPMSAAIMTISFMPDILREHAYAKFSLLLIGTIILAIFTLVILIGSFKSERRA